MYKLDRDGRGEQIRQRDLTGATELSFLNWTDAMVGAPWWCVMLAPTCRIVPPRIRSTCICPRLIVPIEDLVYQPSRGADGAHARGWGGVRGQFLDMCILAGCDYLPSIRNLGIKTAHKLVRLHKRTDKARSLVRVRACASR